MTLPGSPDAINPDQAETIFAEFAADEGRERHGRNTERLNGRVKPLLPVLTGVS
jgi:hypothetical protein